MISTYLGYQLYGQNLARTLQQTSASAGVSQAQQYYNANIGKVKTASDLTGNYRLLSYALQAFGLGDKAYAKGLMTKVLESDLSNSSSLANQLGGNYVKFAQAFNFGPTGALKSAAQLQTSAQQANTEATFVTTTSLSSANASTATSNYTAAIGSVTSLKALEQNSATLGYALSAYGIDPASASTTFEQTIQSNLADPKSYVNQAADSGYLALWQGFTVGSDGSAANVVQAESQTNMQATAQAYFSHTGTAATSQANAAAETSYFMSAVPKITSASQLVADPKIVAYLTNAYQLPSSVTSADIVKALESNPSDPNSFANSSPFPGFKAMAKAFNFDTTGAAGTVSQFQSAGQQQSTISLYMEHQSSDTPAADTATDYYKANISNIKSVSQLEANSTLMDYIETAYGISKSAPTATFTSIIENAGGIATTSPGAGLLALNQAYNVDSTGNAASVYQAQSPASLSATVTAYFNNAGSTAADLTAAKTATGYYETAIPHVASANDLLGDPKLVSYIEQAYNIPATTTAATLTQVLTSNLSDPASVANKLGNNYAQLAAAFNFDKNGLITKEPGGVQTRAQLSAVNNGYLDQQIGTTAGAQNPGIALALYFKFQAPNITSAYSILADAKLVTVFQTMMGLSANASQANIDVQAAQISNSFDLSKLKDPAYLNKLIQRFSVMYDVHPPVSNAPYTATSVLTGSRATLDSTSLFSKYPESAARLLFGKPLTSYQSTYSTSTGALALADSPTSILFGGR